MFYCVRCKKVTDTSDIQKVVSKNGRNMKRGKCAVCGSTKTQFIRRSEASSLKGPSGGSIVNKAINKLPFEMHLPGHNFTGPGTKLKKRLKPDLTPKDWSKPINKVDNAAYHHDVCYMKNKDTTTRNNVCDKDMLDELKGIVNPTLRERMDRSIVEKIIGTKMRFGMGQASGVEKVRRACEPRKKKLLGVMH